MSKRDNGTGTLELTGGSQPRPADKRHRWEIGSYVPTGKIHSVFYIYNAMTMKAARAANGRRRKFKTWDAANAARTVLERSRVQYEKGHAAGVKQN